VEAEMADGKQLSRLRDWGSKLPGAALRVAGILHAANQQDLSVLSVEISREEMLVALELCATLVSHAIAVFGLICEDPATAIAKRLLRWIIAQAAPQVFKRDCFRAHHPHVFERVDQMNGPLSVLESHRLIRVVEKETGGRPSEIIEINPVLLKGA